VGLVDWLLTLSPQQVALISSAFGIPVGFLSLVLGALFNSHLSRRRDDRLRFAEAAGVASALRAELTLILNALKKNTESVSNPANARAASHVFVPEMLTSTFEALLPKLPGLSQEVIHKVLSAYGALPVYMDALALLGGDMKKLENGRVYVAIPTAQSEWLAINTRALIPPFEEAIGALETYLEHRGKRRQPMNHSSAAATP
jgi:hypothetical protein